LELKEARELPQAQPSEQEQRPTAACCPELQTSADTMEALLKQCVCKERLNKKRGSTTPAKEDTANAASAVAGFFAAARAQSPAHAARDVPSNKISGNAKAVENESFGAEALPHAMLCMRMKDATASATGRETTAAAAEPRDSTLLSTAFLRRASAFAGTAVTAMSSDARAHT
jgi:predicted ribonuclease toxin of YeeF-YezG toxin-antitoxin module